MRVFVNLTEKPLTSGNYKDSERIWKLASEENSKEED